MEYSTLALTAHKQEEVFSWPPVTCTGDMVASNRFLGLRQNLEVSRQSASISLTLFMLNELLAGCQFGIYSFKDGLFMMSSPFEFSTFVEPCS